jgi:hypothetical protein
MEKNNSLDEIFDKISNLKSFSCPKHPDEEITHIIT